MSLIANNDLTGILFPVRYAENTRTLPPPRVPRRPGFRAARIPAARRRALACGKRGGQDVHVSSYANFFIGRTGVAGALGLRGGGLLDMLAVRVRPTRTPGTAPAGPDEGTGHQARGTSPIGP
jgi:hypothetical protein